MNIPGGGSMRIKFILFYFLLSFNLCSGQVKFPEFLQYVNSLPYNQKEAVVDSFLAAASLSGIPIIEDTTVYFLYRGLAKFVFVTGDFNEWDENFRLILKVDGTDLQYLKWNLPPDARTLYMIKEIDGTWKRDMYNLKFMPNSESLVYSILDMPKYVEPWEIKHNDGTPKGKIESFNIQSKIMKHSYNIYVYLPPGYDSTTSKNYPSAYFQDNKTFLDLADATNIFDNLISNNSIQPTIAVFIEPLNRNEEYTFSKRNDYANFVATELVQYIDHNYNTILNPHCRLITGVSYGGTISGLISYNYPEVFSNCGLFSAVTYTNNQELFSLFLNNDKKDINFFSIWGTSNEVMHNYSKNFRDLLLSKEYNFQWAQYNEGNNFGFWKEHIDDLLINFFPAESAAPVENLEISNIYFLMQNYPNPFNPTTTISFTIPNNGKRSVVYLRIYDILGREISTLVNDYKSAGNYKIEFNASTANGGLPSGVYFYKLTSGNFSETKKMLLIK